MCVITYITYKGWHGQVPEEGETACLHDPCGQRLQRAAELAAALCAAVAACDCLSQTTQTAA